MRYSIPGLGGRLRMARNVTELTEDKVATELGISWMTVHRWERSQRAVPDRVTQDFARLVREAGLPHLTLHGLRHAHATLMLTSDVHLKIVSERLGHSNIAITADTYSHVLPGMQEAAAEAVELLLRRPDSD